MKKNELLKIMDNELLDKLFGFCYARTRDSHEAEELCSDIVFALVKAAGRQGEIENPYPFIWRVARNVYADFSDKRRLRADMRYEGTPTTCCHLFPTRKAEISRKKRTRTGNCLNWFTVVSPF